MANEKRLIDANAVIKDIDNYYHNSVFPHPGTTWLRGLELAVGLLLKAPAVDAVEVVHGRWIHPKGYVVSNAFFCSVCNHEEVSLHVIHPLYGGGCKADEHGNFYYPPKCNYCSNCGAKMDGRE